MMTGPFEQDIGSKTVKGGLGVEIYRGKRPGNWRLETGSRLPGTLVSQVDVVCGPGPACVSPAASSHHPVLCRHHGRGRCFPILACIPILYFAAIYGPVTSSRYRGAMTPFFAMVGAFALLDKEPGGEKKDISGCCSHDSTPLAEGLS
jgi:hypothetical protein